MKTQLQNLRIAEACKWTKCRLIDAGNGDESPVGYPPGKNYECSVPGYTYDLNACHEMEKLFLPYSTNWDSYVRILVELVRESKESIVCATASQRSEAFLKTLNLWTDDEE